MAVSAQNLAAFLAERTTLFDPGAPITIKALTSDDDQYVDGYLNFLFSARQADRAYIVKQSRAEISSGLSLSTLDPRRNHLEYLTYQLRRGIAPAYIPASYFEDPANHLFITEDLAPMKLLRFDLCQGRQYPGLGRRIGDFLARCHVATSAYCLTRQQVARLGALFDNQPMRRVITDFILVMPSGLAGDNAYDAGIDQLIQAVLSQPGARLSWRNLIADISRKPQCLIHGDFHTSNAFASDHDFKVIDMEYTMLGPFAYDIGYFLANILSQYAAFCLRPDGQAMCDYLLALLAEVYQSYFDGFAALATTGQPFGQLFRGILQDSLGYLAMSNIARISYHGGFPDFDYLTDPADRFQAKTLSLLIAGRLLVDRHHLGSVQQVVDLFEATTSAWRAEMRSVGHVGLGGGLGG